MIQMHVTIELFGIHRIKAESETMSMPIHKNSVVGDALEFIQRAHPHLQFDITSMLITVNRAVVPIDEPLKENDVIRFLPPIGGG